MSSETSCDTQGADCERKKLCKCVFVGIGCLLLLIPLGVGILWLVLHPDKPIFHLRDVALSRFNLTSAPSASLTAAAQVTLSSQNVDDHFDIYYDRMDVYAVYKGQRVTDPAALPRGYLGRHETSLWSPNLFGTSVPLAQPFADSLAQDIGARVLFVDFRVDGRLHWKVLSLVRESHLYVNCPALLTNAAADGYKLHQGTVVCSVDIY